MPKAGPPKAENTKQSRMTEIGNSKHYELEDKSHFLEKNILDIWISYFEFVYYLVFGI